MINTESNVGKRINLASQITGIKVAKACKMAGIHYNTLYNQMRLNREIPFSTITALAKTLSLPLQFFDATTLEPSAASEATPYTLAQKLNTERAKYTRAGFDVTTDHILDWYRDQSGTLRNWDWFSDQVDLYKPLSPTDTVMHPIKLGERSITAERLMLSSTAEFYDVVSRFDHETIQRALLAHQQIEHQGFVVSDEVLNVVVKGQPIKGGYRKVTMRVFEEDGTPVTAVFSKLTWLSAT